MGKDRFNPSKTHSKKKYQDRTLENYRRRIGEYQNTLFRKDNKSRERVRRERGFAHNGPAPHELWHFLIAAQTVSPALQLTLAVLMMQVNSQIQNASTFNQFHNPSSSTSCQNFF